VAFRTLGCRLNQYETEAVAAEFADAGYDIVPFEEPADVYVINSCTITGGADRKSRNLVYRALRSLDAAEPPGAPAASRGPVVLTGCFSERHGEEFAGDSRVLVVGNEAKNTVFDAVSAWRAPPGGARTPADRFGFRGSRGVFRTRAAVKIQDGCDQFCTYCIVPHVRGRAASRDPESILEEVRRTVADGAREIVLTGVNLGRFAHGATDFPRLVERVLAGLPEDGSVRLRISSLEPEGLDGRFAGLFSDSRLAPHVHLCLQSGSDRVLRRMNRHYRVDDLRRIAAELRTVVPELNLTTDIIVGFPAETEEDFTASRDAATELAVGHIHVFPFSPREGTPAARMPQQIAAAVKRERAASLREHSAELTRRYYRSLVGRREEVLIEQGSRGYGRLYVPVVVAESGLLRNEIYPVRITGLDEREDGPVLTAELV
jgi:threonylcarbamoyladenosine tRNA methylthiotransferase MtaB